MWNIRLRDHVELPDGSLRVASRRQLHVELLPDGTVHDAGSAPYLDLHSWDSGKIDDITWDATNRDDLLSKINLNSWKTDSTIVSKWVKKGLARQHYEEMRQKRTKRCVRGLLAKSMNAYSPKLTIGMPRHELLEKSTVLANVSTYLKIEPESVLEDLRIRRNSRLEFIEKEKSLVSDPPNIISKALIVPLSWLIDDADQKSGRTDAKMDTEAKDASEAAGMKAVTDIETNAGRYPKTAQQSVGSDTISSPSTALAMLPKPGSLRSSPDTRPPTA